MKKKSKKSGATKKDKEKEEASLDAKPEATTSAAADEPAPETAVEEATEEPSSPTQATSSLTRQSKLRSSSFRQGPLSPTGTSLSPEGETAADIYRKQVARIEDLEKENKRLAKEASDAERRYKKAEEDLADLQEADRDESENSQVEKLVRSPCACRFIQFLAHKLCVEGRDSCTSTTELTAPVSGYKTPCLLAFNGYGHAIR
jgi:hypothetical protein